MKAIKLFSIIILIAVLISSCSKLKKELPEPTSPTIVHDAGWGDPSKAEFHGNYLKEKSWKRNACTQCHGVDTLGGISKISCFSCHRTYPHLPGWDSLNSSKFHGTFLKSVNWNMTTCKSCHGTTLEGGTSQVSCYSCHIFFPHKAGWLEKGNNNYHGLYLKNTDWNLTSCRSCHGNDLGGGISDIACSSCHSSFPHVSGWEASTSANFHGNYLKSNNWDLLSCKGCHGSSYDGGVVTDESCMASQCHVDASQNKKSPEACNTCHGVFRGQANLITTWAPPKSVQGDTSISVRGVGAHQKHLATGTIGKAVKCTECHSVPAQAFATGHFDSNLPAEVVMNDTLSRLTTDNGTVVPNPIYNSVNLGCSNVYCHGYFKNGNKNNVVNWTGGSAEVACGSCHGDPAKPTLAERALPGGTHIQSLELPCNYCHYEVVDVNMNIIKKEKHINGNVDLKNPPKR